MANYGSHESIQCIEVEIGGEARDTEVLFMLDCVSPGTKAQLYGPPENCYQAEAPEFEVESVHVLTPAGKWVKISEDILSAFAGTGLTLELVNKAIEDAIESGDF